MAEARFIPDMEAIAPVVFGESKVVLASTLIEGIDAVVTLGTDYIAKQNAGPVDRWCRPDDGPGDSTRLPAIRSRSMTEPIDESGLALATLAAQVADSSKATDIVILDVGEVLSITGFFVIAGASNPRLVRATVDEIERTREV